MVDTRTRRCTQPYHAAPLIVSGSLFLLRRGTLIGTGSFLPALGLSAGKGYSFMLPILILVALLLGGAVTPHAVLKSGPAPVAYDGLTGGPSIVADDGLTGGPSR